MTKLIVDLEGIDPDEAYSRIPYEKGSLLLYYLETLYGKGKPNFCYPSMLSLHF